MLEGCHPCETHRQDRENQAKGKSACPQEVPAPQTATENIEGHYGQNQDDERTQPTHRLTQLIQRRPPEGLASRGHHQGKESQREQ